MRARARECCASLLMGGGESLSYCKGFEAVVGLQGAAAALSVPEVEVVPSVIGELPALEVAVSLEVGELLTMASRPLLLASRSPLRSPPWGGVHLGRDQSWEAVVGLQAAAMALSVIGSLRPGWSRWRRWWSSRELLRPSPCWRWRWSPP